MMESLSCSLSECLPSCEVDMSLQIYGGLPKLGVHYRGPCYKGILYYLEIYIKGGPPIFVKPHIGGWQHKFSYRP